MRPVLFVIPLPWVGPLAIKAYGVMLMLGFLFGLWLALWRARREKVSPNIIWDFWVYGLVAGIIGSRALYIFENLDQFSGRWLDVFRIWEGGLSFYGGFALGMIATWIMLHHRRVSAFKIYDLMAVSTAVGLAFGKIGCFLNGCCFGRPTSSFVGVTYPAAAPIDGLGHLRSSPVFQWQLDHGSIAASATQCLPVQPVQLYESAAAFCLAGILLLFYPRRRRYGEVACLFGTLYPFARFFLEFVRQPQAVLVLGLTPEQVFSIIAFVAFATAFVISRKKQPAVAV